VGLSANSNGFVATWLDSNDSNAYASFYPSLLPPTNVKGCISQNIFLTQTEILNIITWNAPIGITPTSYKIYSDANLTNLIATIPGTGPLLYTVHNRKINVVYTYYVVSIDQYGNASEPVEIVVNQNC
jgi:hypothetical protein